MLNRTYWKSILRTVRASLSRFVAIFAIVALGVGFLSGLLASPVDMRLSTDTYCREANLYDIKIQSTQGLTDGDLAAVRAVEGVEGVMPARDMDLVLTSESGESLTTRLQSIPEESLPEEEQLNQLTLVDGRMPSAPGEIAVGLTKDFSGTIPAIGDVLTVNQTENDEDVTDALTAELLEAAPPRLAPVVRAAEALVRTGPQVCFEGAQYLAQDQDVRKNLGTLLELFSDNETGRALIEPQGNKVTATLGEDIRPELPGVCIVSKRYLAGGGLTGAVALVGSNRMAYHHLIPILEYFATKLGQSMSGKKQEEQI